jgi:hypothetical protein
MSRELRDSTRSQRQIHSPKTLKASRKRKLSTTETGDASGADDVNEYENYVLPWEDATEGPQTLFKKGAPKIKYPAGSKDTNKIGFYITTIDGFLRSSPVVKQILEGRRPHPFHEYEDLTSFAEAKGITDYEFNEAETVKTICWVKEENEALSTELENLYNFGGVYSYASVSEQIYMTYFNTLNPDTNGGDLHLLSSCEKYDGSTARKLIMDSLRTLRVGDVSSAAYKHSEKISAARLPMRSGGADAFFGVIDEHRASLKNMNQDLPEVEVVGRIFNNLKGKHKDIDHTIKILRRKAGKEQRSITYEEVKNAITDTFKYDLNDKDKQEPENTPVIVAYAPSKPTGKTPLTPTGTNPKAVPNKRRRFPKGSCDRCPESTTHTRSYCYKDKRDQIGLVAGERWCVVHKKGIHYDSKCNRHFKGGQRSPSTYKKPWAPTPSSGVRVNNATQQPWPKPYEFIQATSAQPNSSMWATPWGQQMLGLNQPQPQHPRLASSNQPLPRRDNMGPPMRQQSQYQLCASTTTHNGLKTLASQISSMSNQERNMLANELSQL